MKRFFETRDAFCLPENGDKVERVNGALLTRQSKAKWPKHLASPLLGRKIPDGGFDILGGKERYRFYGPFNTSIDFGNFVAKIFGSVLLIFLPFRYLFILFAAFMFIMFLLSFKTKKVIESKRK